MVYTFVIIVFLLAGFACIFGSGQDRRRATAHPRWSAISMLCICLVLLASCGNAGSTPQASKTSKNGTPVNIPPLVGKPTHASKSTPTSTPKPTNTPTQGSASTPSNPSGNAPTDWTTYHHDNTRAGYIPNTPDPQQLTKAWSMNLDGAVYAEPLVVGGHVIIVTEGDTVYSLDSQSGTVQWHTNVGTPVPQSTLPCGNIDPLGITGTPVYDPATGLVFAVAEISGPQHILVGVDINSGSVRVRRVVDIPGMDPRVHQQRAALALSRGKVYIAYGGLDGDCGNYHGTVVASQTDGQGQLYSYQVPTAREGGIWDTPGPSIDANGQVYVSVVNGAATGGNWDNTDSVLRLSPTLQYQDGFAPSSWGQDNASDADLGSMGPVMLPNGLIFIAGKSSAGYVLHANGERLRR